MIVAAAVCPHPPVLFRELTGAADPAADLRADCVRAVRTLLAHTPEVVAVVGGDATTHDPAPDAVADPAPFGDTASRADPGTPRLPLSLGVGDRLLAAAGWSGPTERHAVAVDAPAEVCDRLGRDLARRETRTGLLVLGDGSARRGPKAPGYDDPRAHDVDAVLVRGLTEGDPAALRSLDPGTAEELLVQGRAALHVLGAAVAHSGRTPEAAVLRADDPWGVLYAVATWSLE